MRTVHVTELSCTVIHTCIVRNCSSPYRHVHVLLLLLALVSECAGKGTLDSVNGAMATEWLLEAERCCKHWHPFLWVLIRPPWSPHGVCCKACVHLKLKEIVDRGQVCRKRGRESAVCRR